jgi:hypothetical protein
VPAVARQSLQLAATFVPRIAETLKPEILGLQVKPPAEQNIRNMNCFVQWEKLLADEKEARIALLQQSRWEYFRIKAAFRSNAEVQSAVVERFEALRISAQKQLGVVQREASNARHAAFLARIEVKKTTELAVQCELDNVAHQLVSTAISAAVRSVNLDEVSRELWQLKEVEDVERDALLEEEKQSWDHFGQLKRTEAQQLLRTVKRQQARVLGEQAQKMQTTDIALQLWNLAIQEEVVRKREMFAEERLGRAQVQHLMLKDLKLMQSKPEKLKESAEVTVSAERSSEILHAVANAVNVFEKEQEAHYSRARHQLKAQEQAKRRFLVEHFAVERVRLQRQLRDAEAALWEQWAVEQMRVADSKATEAQLERTSTLLVAEAISEAMFEVQAEHQSHIALQQQLEHKALASMQQETEKAARAARKRTAHKRLAQAQEAALHHAVAESPKKLPRPPQGVAGEQSPHRSERRPEGKPEKTGRRIYIRKQADKLRRREQMAAAEQWTAEQAALVLKQRAVDRVLAAPPSAPVAANAASLLPPITSPFNVHAAALLV